MQFGHFTYAPITNRITVALLIVVMLGFGVLAEFAREDRASFTIDAVATDKAGAGADNVKSPSASHVFVRLH